MDEGVAESQPSWLLRSFFLLRYTIDRSGKILYGLFGGSKDVAIEFALYEHCRKYNWMEVGRITNRGQPWDIDTRGEELHKKSIVLVPLE